MFPPEHLTIQIAAGHDKRKPFARIIGCPLVFEADRNVQARSSEWSGLRRHKVRSVFSFWNAGQKSRVDGTRGAKDGLQFGDHGPGCASTILAHPPTITILASRKNRTDAPDLWSSAPFEGAAL